MNVPVVELARHLSALHDHSIAVTSQTAAASGYDPALSACSSAFGDCSQGVIAVIGEHNWDFPLCPCHSAHIGVMGVDQAYTFEMTPELEDTFGIDQLTIVSLQDQNFDVDSGTSQE
jgi:hypothetical protein